jgi:hypothetical protein
MAVEAARLEREHRDVANACADVDAGAQCIACLAAYAVIARREGVGRQAGCYLRCRSGWPKLRSEAGLGGSDCGS